MLPLIYDLIIETVATIKLYVNKLLEYIRPSDIKETNEYLQISCYIKNLVELLVVIAAVSPRSGVYTHLSNFIKIKLNTLNSNYTINRSALKTVLWISDNIIIDIRNNVQKAS
jgi:hypothetical protein